MAARRCRTKGLGVAVASWAHLQTHRESLQGLLRTGPLLPHEKKTCIRALDRTVESFADWRWKTLRRLLWGLKEAKAALVHSTADAKAVRAAGPSHDTERLRT